MSLALHPLGHSVDAPCLDGRFVRAFELALEFHGRQRRAGTEIPFMSHLVVEEGGDEDCAIAALLHDAVEDCGDDALERIHDEFGAEIAALVIECSDGGEATGATWTERKRSHLRHMAEIADDRVLLILLADKVHNARSVVRDMRVEGNALWARFGDRTKRDQLWYFNELVALFGSRCDGPLVDDLRFSVDELQALAASE